MASQGGVDREPHWWLNLTADPRAQVEFRGERFPVVAEKVDDDARPAVWARFSAALGGDRLDGYQAKVRREITVIRLRRVP